MSRDVSGKLGPYNIRTISGELPPPANSLIGDEAAAVSVYVLTSFAIPGSSIVELQPGLLGGSLAYDLQGTTSYGFSIFSALTGANITGRLIIVCTSFNVVWSGNNNGVRSVWLQVYDKNGVLKLPQYGRVQIEGNTNGNYMSGSAVIGLGVGERASFFVENTAPQVVNVVGGPINSVSAITKFQTILIN